jgi:polyisoprenoid-binding protein YceI
VSNQRFVGCIALMAWLIAACAAPGAQVSVTPTPTAASAAPTAAAASTTAPGATATIPAAPVLPSPTASASPSPAASAPIKLTIAPESSEMRFRVREQLTGRPLPGDAVGSTRAVSGEIVLSPAGAIVSDQSKITVDLRTLRSDESRRDNFIQRNTLETAQFPTAELRVREARGLPTPLPTAGEATFELLGDLTVHGVTKPVAWQVTARFGDQEITGTATTEVKMTDFNMTPPRVGPVLSIEDTTRLELDFVATRERAASSAPAERTVGSGGFPEASEIRLSEAAAAPAVAACELTATDDLGPFYKPNAPERASVGSGYVLRGAVRSADGCEPVAEARIEFWLANPRGSYDDAHRATVLTGSQGEYRFESSRPVSYAGRPPHIHLRVTAPGHRTLVTQHYPRAGQTEAEFDLVLQTQ